MDRHSEAACSAAYLMKWRAECLAGVNHREPPGWFDWLKVPPRWTAWLLMYRAGTPLDLIAHMAGVNEARLARALRVAAAMMAFRPYERMIEDLERQVEPFASLEVQVVESALRAVRCAA